MRIAPAIICLLSLTYLHAEDIHVVKALSGGSGHVAGSKFIFDETRRRFVYPQDKSLIVYFEWAAPPGLHTIGAVWKSPDGKPAGIPTDIKIETTEPSVAAYWTFDISPTDASGIWTLETSVDGTPAGSYNFELYVPPRNTAPPKPPETHLPTTDEAYRATVPSLAIIHSLDATDHELDTGLGFVYAQDRVVTAFEVIDGASSIAVEFSDGTSVRASALAGYGRVEDWAVVPVPTGSRAPLQQPSVPGVKVGERVLAFTLENGKSLVAAPVDVAGTSRAGAFPSVRINPPLPQVSAGSPVLNPKGEVFGVLGAWATPGARISEALTSVHPAVWSTAGNAPAVTPLEAIQPESAPMPLQKLTAAGVFTTPLQPFANLVYADTTDIAPRRNELPDRTIVEFNRKMPALLVTSLWERRQKLKSAYVSVAIFDSKNAKRGESEAKKVSFGDIPYRLTNSVALASLESGSYRIELLVDGHPVWRKFVKVRD